jgi:hypothetical protein
LLKPQIFERTYRESGELRLRLLWKNFAHDFWIQGNIFPLGTNCTEVEILWKTARAILVAPAERRRALMLDPTHMPRLNRNLSTYPRV